MELYLWLFAIPAVLISVACVLYILSWVWKLVGLVWWLFVQFSLAANQGICWLLYRRWARRMIREIDATPVPMPEDQP